MKRTMKMLPVLVALLAVAMPAAAFDFGLTITDDSTVSGSGDEIALSQDNQAIAWFSTNIGDSSSLYLSALYEFYGDFTFAPTYSSAILPASFTAGRVEWEGAVGLGSDSSLRWSIGRVPFQDYSGRIVNSLFDGARAELTFGTVETSVSVAYTGLTFKDDAKILIDEDDEAVWANTKAIFAPKRLVASASAKFIELLPKHDFGIDGWAAFDLDTTGDAVTHTQYAEPYIEGRIGRSWRWRIWGAAEFGEDPDFFYAMAAGARLRFALPEALGLRVTAATAWAGGDYDGAAGLMRAFKPITSGSLATIGSALFSDALGASLDLSLSPFRGMSVGMNGAANFDPAAVEYLGFEASGRATYRPVNDFSISVTGGAFIPNTVVDSSAETTWSVSASVEVQL